MSADLLLGDVVLTIISLIEAKDVCALGTCSSSWRRWPHVDIAPLFRSMFVGSAGLHPPPEDWKALHSSFEVTKYLSVVKKLSALYLGFEDVQLFLFRPKLDVVVNLIGVHYSILYLCVPDENHIRKVSLAELATSKELPILVMLNRTNDTFWIQRQNGSHFEPKPVPPPLPNKCDWEIEPSELDFPSSTVIGKGCFGGILRAPIGVENSGGCKTHPFLFIK